MKTFGTVLLFAVSAFCVPTFTTQPSIVYNPAGQNWTISFGVSETTDVEVSVVRLSDSSIVRHLAAGKLGANPPAPLQGGALTQTLAWDGRGDLGQALNLPAESLSVRVRAGMSVALDRMTTPDPYDLGQGNANYPGWGQMCGICTDEEGNAYVFNSIGTMSTTTLRKYDKAGNYLRTLYPFPGDMSAGDASGYGINEWSAGGWYSPRATGDPSFSYTGTLIGSKASSLVAHLINGRFVFFTSPLAPGYTPTMNVQKIQLNGLTTEQKAIVPSPAMPYWRGLSGDPLVCPVPGKTDEIFLSGIYETEQGSGDGGQCIQGGFWQEGQVFKFNIETGQAVSWLSLDSVPFDTAQRRVILGNLWGGFLSAVRGLATDDSGRVYVCDRLHQRVAVYDTSANLLGSIAVRDPELVAVNKYNGAVYVMTRWLDNAGYPYSHLSLYKFSGWKPGYRCMDTLVDFMSGVNEGFGHFRKSRPYLSLVQSDVKPVLWCAGGNNVWIVDDEGPNLKVLSDFASRRQEFIPGFNRLMVDKRDETVYINDGWANLFKIEDFSNPVMVPCSTAAGQRLYGTDLTLGPNNLFYVREGTSYSGPITRYSLDGRRRFAPAPFSNSGTNVLTPYIYSRFGAGYGEKGMAVSPDNDVAVAYMAAFGVYLVGLFGDSTGMSGDTACDSTQPWDNRILSGVENYKYTFSPRYDLQGNLYVGVGRIYPAGYTLPAGFAADDNYLTHIGAVVRIPAGTKGYHVVPSGVPYQITVADTQVKIYPFPVPVVWAACLCQSPRFDLDPYGRFFVPNFYSNQVTIYDNAGVQLAQFGHYGNVDSWGPASPVPGVDIPLALPLAVTASENFVYVSDMANCRVVRVRMNYALENMHIPEALSEKAKQNRVLSLTSSPNPFNPMSRISVSLPGASRVDLKVYNVSGRLVRSLASGDLKAGVHRFIWDARDAAGRNVSAGLYVYKLTAGNRVLMEKAVLAK